MRALAGRLGRPLQRLERPHATWLSAPTVLVALWIGAATASARSPATVFSFSSAPPEAIVDVDADGIDDAWELLNGLDPANPAHASLDPDGDGLPALAEYQQGTDPWCADSNRDGTADGQSAGAAFPGLTVINDANNQAALSVFYPGA